ncbi:hypothetical protein J6590_104295 [Homalodisca vitripennis]|nr:hypothetical protein J6590_104295 [Homalodisca vitripennis]
MSVTAKLPLISDIGFCHLMSAPPGTTNKISLTQFPFAVVYSLNLLFSKNRASKVIDHIAMSIMYFLPYLGC